jgi:predicted site-specific integrase-resolvase
MKKKISTYAKEHDLSYKTVWRMVKANKLSYEKLPSGTILINEDDKKDNKDIEVALYSRVSSSENKENLNKQLERLENFSIAKGWKIKYSIKEIGFLLQIKSYCINNDIEFLIQNVGESVLKILKLLKVSSFFEFV